MPNPREMVQDVEAMILIYVEACEQHATADIRSQLNPDDPRLHHRWIECRIARDNVWRELLDAVNRLRDAGEPIVASNMLRSASGNASLAETLATRRELLMLKGAA